MMDMDQATTALNTVLSDPPKIKAEIEALKGQIKEKNGRINQLQLLYRAATATKREYKKREKKTAPAPVFTEEVMVGAES